jgi:hypothetical protein
MQQRARGCVEKSVINFPAMPNPINRNNLLFTIKFIDYPIVSDSQLVTIPGGLVLWQEGGHGCSEPGGLTNLGEKLKDVAALNFQSCNHR